AAPVARGTRVARSLTNVATTDQERLDKETDNGAPPPPRTAGAGGGNARRHTTTGRTATRRACGLPQPRLRRKPDRPVPQAGHPGLGPEQRLHQALLKEKSCRVADECRGGAR